MPRVTFGKNRSYGPTFMAALEAELGIPEGGRYHSDEWLQALVLELSRVTGVALAYAGESYGYRVDAEDESGEAYLRVFAARHGLIAT